MVRCFFLLLAHMGCRALSDETLSLGDNQRSDLQSAEIYTDILRMRESPVVGTAMPVIAASSKSKKRTRAHDDVVILTEKRSRKGPGFYTNFADTAPMELEVAGESFAHSISSSMFKHFIYSILCQSRPSVCFKRTTDMSLPVWRFQLASSSFLKTYL